jgi:uncharacterized protein (TIGR00251 family)
MSVILNIKAKPSSRKSYIAIDNAGQLCVCLISAPDHGKANQELVKLLAKQLHITQQQITLLTGHTSRQKRICIVADEYPDTISIMKRLMPNVCLQQRTLFS